MRKQAGGRGKHEKCGKISAMGKNVIWNSKQTRWRGDPWFHSVFWRISMILIISTKAPSQFYTFFRN
jgi:hypothetical protein